MASQIPCFPVVRNKKRTKKASSNSLPTNSRDDADGGEEQRNNNNNKNNNNNDDDFGDLATMDANDYLCRVVDQARRLPNVFFVNESSSSSSLSSYPSSSSFSRRKHRNDEEPIDGSAACLAYLCSDRTALIPPPSVHHLPHTPHAWVDRTLEAFSRLRRSLKEEEERRQWILSKQQDDNNMPHEKITHRWPVPAMKDRPSWHIFCVGMDEARGNEGSYFDDDDDDDNDKEEDQTSHSKQQQQQQQPPSPSPLPNLWRTNLPPNGYPPTVRLLLQMDQVMIRSVLAHLAYYLQDGWAYSLSQQRAVWIYALLARLERHPLHRDDAAVLWSLLRRLTLWRAQIAPKKGAAAAASSSSSSSSSSSLLLLSRLNVLIVILGIYFDQAGGYDGVMTVR